jgi:hypothetical protein
MSPINSSAPSEAADVAVDVRNDSCAHPYSKIEVTTSSMLRCTSWSSVSDQVTATWQARACGNALAHQLARVDQEAGAHAFAEPVLAKVAHLLAQLGEVIRESRARHRLRA